MPAILAEAQLNYSRAETELDGFKAWVAGRRRFKEREVVRELRKYDHLCLLMSFLGTRGRPDRFKHEFAIQGAFRADLVAGSSRTRHFTLIEFEGGEENSLFRPGSTNQMRDWSAQIRHALGQIIDWSWALNDAQHSKILHNAIGYEEFGKTYVVVCGLNQTMDRAESSRLAWLNDHCRISDNRILFMTFDDFILHFEGELDVYRAARVDARAHNSASDDG